MRKNLTFEKEENDRLRSELFDLSATSNANMENLEQ